MPTSNFQPIRFLDPDCCYKFTYLMANSADPDQLAWFGSTLFVKAGYIRFSRTRVKPYANKQSPNHPAIPCNLVNLLNTNTFYNNQWFCKCLFLNRLSSGPFPTFFFFLVLLLFPTFFFSENALLSLLFHPKIFEVTKICKFFPPLLRLLGVCKIRPI